jgi:hypothetical protein
LVGSNFVTNVDTAKSRIYATTTTRICNTFHIHYCLEALPLGLVLRLRVSRCLPLQVDGGVCAPAALKP